ncbi:lysine--tRNA ligase [Fischerella thermalis CCMEE 5319]|nr:lysine--tRNA ligase [Fischerella thermalis CCMEE 5319]
MLSEQELQRRESLKKLIELGINPYPADEYPVTHHATDILQHFSDDQPQEFASVSLAGRIMSKRLMGKAAFFDLKDATGKIQIYFQRDQICPTDDKTLYNEVVKKHIDIGDFIGIKGYVFRTQMGELTVHVHTFTFLSKALRPLPIVKVDAQGQVHDAFTDPEQRYRMRYVDLVVNPHVKDIFIKRTRIIQAMREYFNSFGYLEVETPILQPIPGGATARPFITHHNALDIPLYLRIANELYLKRLIVGGFEGVYEFAKNFRNEGMDRTHNPEFTGMEIYVAYKDYHWMMQFTENLLEHVTKAINNGSTQVLFGKHTIDFKAPYPRITMYEAIRRYTGIDISGMDEDQLRQTCHQLHIDVTPEMGKAKLIDAIFGEKCEPHFIQPTFIIDYPIEMSPLCKKHRHDPQLTERFELIVNGKEIANAYSELNDPLDQRQRFEEQLRLSQRGDDEAMFIDHDFLRALEYGMPPTAGLGIGIDRLTMLLTGQTSIQEVLFFPQMKPEQFTTAPKTDTWAHAGIPEEWIPLAQEAFGSLDTMRSLKPTQVHQQLNGLRKKKKLTIPALQLSEVEAWFTQN